MAVPILATKLYIPPYHPKVVVRTRLIEQINRGLSDGNKLTLISAPAGFGKTTLTTEWITHCGRPVAWLSLDEGDSDPIRFLTYFVAALRTVLPTVGQEMLDALNAAQSSPPPIEAILATLLNQISSSPGEITLVLDDYHIIDSRTVDNALSFFIEHMPPQVHVVITTREDPALPIPRLRARNQLTELRAADLRFTPAEAAEFLSQMMGLDLSADEVAALESRTEGWIAGLQLAALSIKGHADVTEFIRVFAGDHRYIVDYLVEEVLQRQPEETRIFLLQTSILNRLNGSLCDAVTSQAGGKARLESLQRGNLFLIPLDDKRHWYRYHHLFAEMLRMHLIAEQPDQVPVLHKRASEWYEQNGSAAEAIHHALAGGDFERAADLMERGIPEMRRRQQSATLLGWLRALPDELIRSRPVLSVGYAWTLLAGGELEAVESRLQDAEQCLHTSTEMIVADEAELRLLPAAIAVYRAGRAQALGDVAETTKYARQALDLLPEDDHLWRGAAEALMGLASWTSGDLETAYQMYASGTARVRMDWNLADAISNFIYLADIRMAQGRLHEAMNIYEQALQLATEQGESLHGTADLFIAMSEIQREHNDLHAAIGQLQKSKEIARRTGIAENRYRWCIAMARIKQVQDDPEGALDLLREAERLYVRDFSPNVRPVAALKARVWLAQGKLRESLDWARDQGLSAEDPLSYLREFEHITLARVLVARSTRDATRDAVQLLERLLQAAERGGRLGSVIEILILQALVHQAQDDTHAALLPLRQAMMLAEPEGYVRMFLDEGPPMEQLLREAAVRKIMPDYAGRLLSAFDADKQSTEEEAPRSTSAAASPLIEPLSQRELDILRLLKTELSGPEIARELVIGLSTVRTHTKSIYNKLNVNSRRAAVKRAIELGLL